MPTGYTATLYEGKPTTFVEFTMQCARAFGALITMRDDPADAPIPDEFTPSPWNADRLAEAQARLQDVLTWTHGDAEDRAEADYEQRRREHEQYQAEKAAVRVRYDAMLAEVRAWQPPTHDHDGLKGFMVEQLTNSISFDCPESRETPQRVTGAKFREDVLAKTRRDIEYHAAEAAKEIARAAERTAWVRSLRDNLAALTTEAQPRPSEHHPSPVSAPTTKENTHEQF